MRWNRDVWDSLNQCIIPRNIAVTKFGLLLSELRAWAGLRQWLIGKGYHLKGRQSNHPQAMEWSGAYSSSSATTPKYLVKGKHIQSLRIPAGHEVLELTEDAEIYIV
jgi:hypothetical protein